MSETRFPLFLGVGSPTYRLKSDSELAVIYSASELDALAGFLKKGKLIGWHLIVKKSVTVLRVYYITQDTEEIEYVDEPL